MLITNVYAYNSSKDQKIKLPKSKLEDSSLTELHIFLEFDKEPSYPERKLLEDKGLRVHYCGLDNSCAVTMHKSKIKEISNLNKIQVIKEVPLKWRLDPRIIEDNIPSYAITEERSLKIWVRFYDDIPPEEMERIVTKYGKFVTELEKGTLQDIEVPKENIIDLVNEDGVRTVSLRGAPYTTFNSGARIDVSIDYVQDVYGLKGGNVIVGIWDEALVDKDHNALKNRVIWNESSTVGISGHATHVAGTLGGNGTGEPTNKGMAPNISTFISYSFQDTPYDGSKVLPWKEYPTAVNIYGIELSQNSWGLTNITNQTCSDMGDYRDDELEFDNIVNGRSIGKGVPIFFAVGNDRDLSTCDNISKERYGDVQYGTIIPPSTAKNVISVGAVYSDKDEVTCFSNFGPTEDGRLKPDVVAPGDEGACKGSTAIRSTYYPAPSYVDLWGTSMATPVVSGTAALMIEQYWKSYNQFYPSIPLPSTIKAILIQTARDINNTGPDFASGYGIINATEAVDIIRDKKLLEREFVDSSEEGTYHEYNITVAPGDEELKITLAWDDTTSQSIYQIPLLENNLDLSLISPENVIYYPWKLDPYNASLPASRGKDDRNVVEQVQIDNPTEGVWTIKINATTLKSHQAYSLVGSHLGYEKIFYVYNEGNTTLSVSSITTNQNWLKVDKSSLSISNGSYETVTASVNTTGMGADIYSANITINSNDANEGATIIPVVLDLTRTDNDGDGFYSRDTGGNDPRDDNPSITPLSGAPPPSNLTVFSLTETYSKGYNRTFEFMLANFGATDLSGINWSIEFGDGTINFSTGLSLNSSKNITIQRNHTYSTNGYYIVRVNVTDGTLFDTKILNITVPYNLFINIKTLKDSYTDNELVNITDPPASPPNYFITKDTAWTILKQDYISEYIKYKFVYINDSYYRVDWRWKKPLVKNILEECSKVKSSKQESCIESVSADYFANRFNIPPEKAEKFTKITFTEKYFPGHNFEDVINDVKSLKNKSLPKEIIKGNADIIGEINPFLKENGSFYIHLKDGFYNSNGLRIKWGFNSVLAEFNNNKTEENLTFTELGNVTRYLKLPKNVIINSSTIDLEGYEGYWKKASFNEPSGTVFYDVATVNGTYFWITDANNDRIYKFNITGGVLGNYSSTAFGSDNPRGITTYNGTYFWVVDFTDKKVYKVDSNFNYVSDFSFSLYQNSPYGVATNNGTYFWITDYTDDTVYKYTSNGIYMNKFKVPEITNTIIPNGISTTDGTYFWIAEYEDFYMYKLDELGNHLTHFDMWSLFNAEPRGVDTDNGTNLFITDSYDERLLKIGYNYPTNVIIDSSNDSFADYTNTSEVTTTINNVNLNKTAIQNYVDSCTPDTEGYCYVPIMFSLKDTGGILKYSDINIVYSSIPEENQSKIKNNGLTNASIYLLMKVQYWTGSSWVDESTIQDDITLRSIAVGEENQLKLDTIWNPNAWDTSTASHGKGTYRAYVAATNESNGVLKNYDGTNLIATYNFSIISKFSIKNSGNDVAYFDELGNLFLKNTLTQSTTPIDTSDDEFLLKNDSGTVVAKINSTGYMEIKGTLQQNQGTLTNPPGNDFLIKDDSLNVVAYINESGFMFLKGSLYENSIS